ncbi:hypothetical protein SBA4_530028 [Candidatus Sulfopaludibacter sp. SbA4]|nr:hypothetical protein SBA4_530028 [Candidatus Sulfopaludibacter sp. SbA4]
MSSPENTPRLFVYHYEHLDNLDFVKRPEDVYNPDELEQRSATVRAALVSAGWEGDGGLGLIWLPPFVDVGVEDTWGVYLWHVKQRNNGVSWIASECPLTSWRLLQQNNPPPVN